MACLSAMCPEYLSMFILEVQMYHNQFYLFRLQIKTLEILNEYLVRNLTFVQGGKKHGFEARGKLMRTWLGMYL